MEHQTRRVRRGGPVPYCRLNSTAAALEGLAVLRHVAAGRSIRQAARTLGMSPTTAWRRYWLVMDWTLPLYRDGRTSLGPRPPQRGTAAWARERGGTW